MVYVIKTPVSLVLQDTTLNYFSTLVKLDFLKIVNLRLFVQNPCTERAQINLLYCYCKRNPKLLIDQLPKYILTHHPVLSLCVRGYTKVSHTY